MRYIFFLIFIFLFSCTTKKATNIIDYSSKPNDFYQRSLSLEQQLRSHTVVFVNNKIVTFEKLQELFENEKISKFRIIDDSSEIKKMGYSYEYVKKIIIATKK